MAIIHRATLAPGKLDLLAGWLPGRSWCPASTGEWERVGAFRFDDPAGEVGVETMIVRAGDGPPLQVPLTYRAAPLAGAEPWLIGTTEHSTLGTRWVYDGVGDPVYRATLVHAVRTGGTQAEEYVETPDGPQRRDPLTEVRGSGTAADVLPDTVDGPVRIVDGDPTVFVVAGAEVGVRRILTDRPAVGSLVLTGRWPGAEAGWVLAEIG